MPQAKHGRPRDRSRRTQTPAASRSPATHPLCPIWQQIRGSHELLLGFHDLLEPLAATRTSAYLVYQRVNAAIQFTDEQEKGFLEPALGGSPLPERVSLRSWAVSPSREVGVLPDPEALGAPYFDYASSRVISHELLASSRPCTPASQPPRATPRAPLLVVSLPRAGVAASRAPGLCGRVAS